MNLLIRVYHCFNDFGFLVGQAVQVINSLIDQVVSTLNHLVEFRGSPDGLSIQFEVSNVRLDGTDRDERSIKIRAKGAKNRIFAYQPSLGVLLQRWVNGDRGAEFHAADSTYLIPTSKSERISTDIVHDVILKAAEDAGLQDVYGTSVDGRELRLITPHTLRHSFAMAALDRGMNLKLFSSALGHADVNVTTHTCMDVSGKQFIEGYQSFGPTIVGVGD